MVIAEVYYKLIKAGRKTIEQVPTEVRYQVQILLDNEVKMTENEIVE